MKTAIIGGGKACRGILEMVLENRLKALNLEIVGVVDADDNKPGMEFARLKGIPTFRHLDEMLAIPGLEMIIELVGHDKFLEELYRIVPAGVRILDHLMAKVFGDMENLGAELERELIEKEALGQKLRSERNLLQQVLDSVPDAVILVDGKNRLQWVNARLEDITDLHPENLVFGKEFVDPFCGPGEDGAGVCYFREVSQTREPLQVIQMVKDKEGVEQYYRIHVTPIWDEKGNLAHLVETARTITEVVEQTRETATRERRFRQFVEHALDMISMKDMEGRYMVVNHAAAAFIGMNPMDCIGRTDEEIAPPELARAIVANDREILEGRHYKRQLEKVRRRGVAVHLDTIRFPLWNYKGEVTGVCSISRDVTDQKKLEQEVLKSEKMAAIGQLATSVAHEINNPLTGVLTFAEELRADAIEADPQSPAIADFDVIIREAKRCRTIVSNLLDFARLKNHNLRREDLNHIIERCLVLLKRQAEYDGVVFDLKLWPKMPEIRCDSDQIQQVVMNLVINATDAMGGRGRVGVETRLSANGKFVEMEVTDQGPGVPAEIRKTIFEPFFSTKRVKGIGLGLSVVQTIIQQHQGSIAVGSGPGGKGARFIVRLPLVWRPGEERMPAPTGFAAQWS